ncbi:MAG: beta-lactamase family protein [Gammaproteobacteria bacterium]|nr:beta-lactamase family protein [Gammaproteobacteria bacterium]MDH3806777.1 beta-lactamase family protein [Gammaproteobacteria bacterium]
MKMHGNWLLIAVLAALLSLVASCDSSSGSGNSRGGAPNYTPTTTSDGWQIATPAGQGVDEAVLNTAYQEAQRLPNLFSLLVVKNGYLIAEGYFNGAHMNQAFDTASVTKSITSALTGIAVRDGLLTSVDQRMFEFFPEIGWQQLDSRKSSITIRQMLQMRSGYPWEEFDGYLGRLLSTSGWIDFAAEFPLVADPGSKFGYSNLTAHLVGVIVARAASESLLAFGERSLFDPLGISVASWAKDAHGYYTGSGATMFTARDMARFGQLYLDGGAYGGMQLVPAEWVRDSFESYSGTTYNTDILNAISQLEYGYLWWSGVSGPHRFNFAWGHGGQLICVVQDLNMVIVTTATGLGGEFGQDAWRQESSVLELAGRLIALL